MPAQRDRIAGSVGIRPDHDQASIRWLTKTVSAKLGGEAGRLLAYRHFEPLPRIRLRRLMAELGVPCGLGSFWHRWARLLAKEFVESSDPEGRRGGPLGRAIVLPSGGTDTEGWSRLLGGAG